MGRKRNLQVLHDRRIYLKNKVEALPDTDMFKEVFEEELEALVWALKKLEAEEIDGVGESFQLGDVVHEVGYPEEVGVIIELMENAKHELFYRVKNLDRGTTIGYYPEELVLIERPGL